MVNRMQHLRQQGFLQLPNDNIFKTIGVALLLCLVCSIVVSTVAVMLKPIQVSNQLLHKKSNILTVAGIEDSSKSIDELFQQVETNVIELTTGTVAEGIDPVTFDQERASKDASTRVELSDENDIAQIGGRSKYANVYLVRDGATVSKIILPIKGYGLWSTMYGFLALEGDAQTVSGVTFYEHGETPGLGGEIDNKKWQSSWQGKKLFNEQGQPKLSLIKGITNADTPELDYKIDGLAGATLTSNGVTNLIQFWVGENGFGPYLERVRNSGGSANAGTLLNSRLAYRDAQPNIGD